MWSMAIGPSGSRFRNIHGNLALGGYPSQSVFTTNLTGTNNDLVYTSRHRGTRQNSNSIAYVVSGNNTPLSVSVSGRDVTVNVATGSGGAATSTAAQVKAAIEANAAANNLFQVSNAAGNDGTGIVTALSKTSASGAVDYVIGSRR